MERADQAPTHHPTHPPLFHRQRIGRRHPHRPSEEILERRLIERGEHLLRRQPGRDAASFWTATDVPVVTIFATRPSVGATENDHAVAASPEADLNPPNHPA